MMSRSTPGMVRIREMTPEDIDAASQLESTNPYNTRKFAGLPPGPICQVVANAIDATLNYEKHDYLFFIADEEGIVRYSTDQAGHESNINEHGLVKDEDEQG